MKLVNTDSWAIYFEFPEALQFALYIAKQEQFDQHQEPQPEAEAAWYEWWTSLRQLDENVLSVYPTMYDPPQFDSLSAPPVLRDLCRQHWQRFHQMWGVAGGKQNRLSQILARQLQNYPLNKLVNQCARDSGKRHPAAFRLHVDFLEGLGETYHIRENHWLLDTTYLEDGKKWYPMLREYIMPLI